MIVVKVELYSAVSGEQSEIARMVIDNIGGTVHSGDYRVRTMRGRTREALEKYMWSVLHKNAKPVKEGQVMGHPRLQQHVWNLVAKGLHAAGYGDQPPKEYGL